MAVNPKGELDLTGVTKPPTSGNPLGRTGGTAHYKRSKGDLFPRGTDPTSTDVKQVQLGDCFLLAALLSILGQEGGGKTIAGIMKDLDNGKVVVRLYNDKGIPQYVKVEKSIRKHEEKHNQGPLWVAMIEKAFAVSDTRTSLNTLKGGTGWAKLHSGGDARFVFAAILGGSGKTETLGDRTDLPFAYFSKLWDTKAADFDIKSFSKEIFDNNEPTCKKFLQWRTDNVFQFWANLTKGKVVRIEHLNTILKDFNAPTDISDAIWVYVNKHQLLGGQRGTGKYASNALKIYDKISEALRGKHPVVVATKSSVGKPEVSVGTSGGEKMTKGLAGDHAYAVLAVSQEGDLRYFTLQNPWGHTGREYSSEQGEKLTAARTDSGKFKLELSDLMKRISKISISGNAINLNEI